MATFVQNGDKVRITIGTSIYDYNLREVDYTHNGTTITVETDGYTRHNIAYLDVTSPSSTDIQDLVDQLNAYKVSISTTVDTTGLATESTLSSIDGKTIANVIDPNNSTSTPLGIGGVFTGIGTDVSDYNSVTIQLFADQDSATDGMCFQFSTDNVNWDDSNDYNLDVSVSNVRRFQFPVTAQYFRVKYDNGSVAQTEFRVQTILHNTDVLTSIHRLDTGLTNDRSVTVTKSVIAGETTAGGGAFVNVKVNPSGSLEVNASQDTHDDLNANANLQVGDVDVSASNPIPVSITSGAVEGASEVDLLKELIILTKYQIEQQTQTNKLLKLLLS
jgi:hypothetical protein